MYNYDDVIELTCKRAEIGDALKKWADDSRAPVKAEITYNRDGSVTIKATRVEEGLTY